MIDSCCRFVVLSISFFKPPMDTDKHRWQKHPDQNPNDSNHDEQLYERKSNTVGHLFTSNSKLKWNPKNAEQLPSSLLFCYRLPSLTTNYSKLILNVKETITTNLFLSRQSLQIYLYIIHLIRIHTQLSPPKINHLLLSNNLTNFVSSWNNLTIKFVIQNVDRRAVSVKIAKMMRNRKIVNYSAAKISRTPIVLLCSNRKTLSPRIQDETII